MTRFPLERGAKRNAAGWLCPTVSLSAEQEIAAITTSVI